MQGHAEVLALVCSAPDPDVVLVVENIDRCRKAAGGPVQDVGGTRPWHAGWILPGYTDRQVGPPAVAPVRRRERRPEGLALRGRVRDTPVVSCVSMVPPEPL